MRHLRRLGVIMVLALFAAAGTSLPAAAGGPTSVFVAYPKTERTASAYHSDELYQRLADALGIDTSTGIDQQTPSEPDPGLDGYFGSEVRVTWLIHDMSVWRVDRIFLTGDAVWIETRETMNADDDGEPRWRQPADPTKVREVLTETGVLRDDPKPTGAASQAPAPETSEPARQTAAAIGAGGPPAAGIIGVGSGVLGLTLGIAGTMYLRHRRTRSNPDRIILTG